MRRKTALSQPVRKAQEIALDKLQVNMSNALNNAAQGLSLAEKRVMMFAVSKLDSLKSDGGTPNGAIRLSAREYAGQFNVDARTAYEQLKDASDGIFNRYIRFFEPDERGGKDVKIRWVSRAEYHEGEGWIALRFTQEVKPHLTILNGQFTKYKLAQASALRSIYSWRLLEMLSQYASTGWRQISLDEFHHAMETPETYRQNFKDCRQRVIEPAVKELQAKDGWSIEWKPIKNGRKVAELRFKFQRSPQERLPLDFEEDLAQQPTRGLEAS